MSVPEDTYTNPKSRIMLPAGLAVLSMVCVVLPVVTVRMMGFGGGLALSSPLFMGGLAFLLPLAFSAGLAARFVAQAQPHIRALEITGLIVAIGIVLYAALTISAGFNEISNANQQMSKMLGSAHARQFSTMGGLSLSSGCLALAALVAGSAWQVWAGRVR